MYGLKALRGPGGEAGHDGARSPRLRRKLLSAVWLYQLLLAGIGVIGLLAVQASLGGVEVAVEHYLRELSVLNDLTSEVSRVHSLSLLYGLADPAGQAAYIDQIAQSRSHVQSLLDELLQIQERFEDQDDIDSIAAFRVAWSGYVHVQDQKLLSLRGPGHEQEFGVLTGSGGALTEAYAEVSTRLAELQRGLPREDTERLTLAEQGFTRNRNFLLLAAVLAAMFGIGFGLWHSARLARAVEALSSAARQVASGDLTQRVRVRTGDELESLADSFNAMTDNLQRMVTAQHEHLNELEVTNQALQSEVAERRRAEAALRESETKFRSVTQSVNEAIVSTDIQGRINLWNRGAERMFGYTESEAVGMSFAVLLDALSQEELARGPAGGLSRWTGQTTEIVGRRKDGSDFPLELSVTEWMSGADVFFTSTMRDVTERRAMEQLKNEFVSMVSHELRTPMNGVIAMVDLLLRTELDSRQLGYAQALERSGESLLGIIDDIVDFSKIEVGKFKLEMGHLDVRDVVESAATLLSEQATSKGLEIAVLVDPDVPDRLQGDRRRVHQVLLNLIGNAIKFTHTGEVVVRARVEASTAEQVLVRFEVSDTGIGIPEAAMGRLFQPFVQVHNAGTRQYGGTGLGLAISKRLVELMGGTVGVSGSLGRGSTFWFTAPLSRQSAADAPPGVDDYRRRMDRMRLRVVGDNATARPRSVQRHRRELHRPQPQASRIVGQAAPHILVVEDTTMNQLAAQSTLEELGYRVHVVASGFAALTELGRRRYAAVLMDCQMPGLDGFETTAEIRRREAGQHRTPIIAITASAMLGDRERCLAAGMDDYISKPVRLVELDAVLKRWLPGPQAIRAAGRPSSVADEDRHNGVIEPDVLAGLRGVRRRGQPDVVAEMIDLFRVEAPRRLASLRDAARASDAEGLRVAAHALRGTAAAVGAHVVRDAASDLEARAVANDFQELDRLIDSLETALEQACTALEAMRTESDLCES